MRQSNGDRADDVRAVDWDDGYWIHAPVDAFAPNPFGLFHVHGNVAELCADLFEEELRRDRTDSRIARGGSYVSVPGTARSAIRLKVTLGDAHSFIGVRAARSITVR